ncbi:eukaryotic translation initiation factor 4E-4 [Rhodotorula diobovata]|uniref:Eukaryotic translation initiation factor 4E-4 n=1 Tax=Rhodotorula diobovata TaxID=5288 RepID=A0A5C5FXE0_9BASI|nr:eukaryotic translation initiation factor 4E-4 [Rhodotorula diobovata]
MPSALSSTSSSSRRREPSFPAYQTRGSSSLASPVGSPTVAPRTVAPTDPWGPPQRKKGGPSLSLALGGSNGTADDSIHPLKYTWDVWFSQRQAGTKTNKKDDKAGVTVQKEKESREDWEGGVVKLGGFSSIESLHPFLAHLVPPSALPSSAHSTHALFSGDSPESAPAPSNLICDYNVFRSAIAPAWEDSANVGGGRWVVRLRKGVADRVWEEVVYALVSERIGSSDDDRVGEKVNGVVLSVRRDEDILSLWVAPSSRTERDIIRDSLRSALSPLLTATSAAALQLDYKPHPVTGASSSATPSRLQDLSGGNDPTSTSPSSSSSPRHTLRRGGAERRSHSGALRSAGGGAGERDEHEHLRLGAPGSERRSDRGTPRTPGSGFSSYVSSRMRDGTASPLGGGGGGAGESPLSKVLDGSSAFERIERRVRESSPAAGGRGGASGGLGGTGAFGRASPTMAARSRESSARFEDDSTRWGRL